jgi:DNA recombination protein RmuC
MLSPSFILVATLAFALGIGIAWLLGRQRILNAKSTGKLEAAAEHALRIGVLETQLSATESARGLLFTETETLRGELSARNGDLNALQVNLARISAELGAERENARQRLEDEGAMANTFASLARTALSENSTSFIATAKQSFEREQEEARGALEAKHTAFLETLDPIQEKMTQLDQRVERLSEDKQRLAEEAKNLSNALRKSEIRGRWGEITLQRVAELAGMKNRCDFILQQTILSDDQSRRRPDMIVNLPLGRYVVVDSKAVMDAYVSACATDDSAIHADLIAQHAKHIRTKIDELAKVDYAKVLEKEGKNVADMVVCYIPGEAFFAAAIGCDPLLLEYAAQKRVFLASPTILIVLLRAIALGWRDHELSQNAEHIRKLGRELYGRLAMMKGHFDTLGSSIEKTVSSYNSMVSSLNRSVFPQARRFQNLGATEVGAKPLLDAESVEQTVHDHTSADWQQGLALAASGEDEHDKRFDDAEL